MTHKRVKKHPGYDNSQMKTLKKLMAQPAINYKSKKYQILLEDLQAGILKHQNKKNTVYLFLEFKKQEKVKKWISDFAKKITTAKKQLDHQADQIITFSLTNAGYDFLDLPESIKPDDQAFRGDMNQRLQFGTNRIDDKFSDLFNIHAIIMIASDSNLTERNATDKLVLKKKIATQLINNKEKNLEILFQQTGSKKNVPIGKSSFKDGFTNPKYFPGNFSSKKQKDIKQKDIPALNLALRIDKGGNSSASCGSLGAFARFEFNQGAIKALTNQIKKQTTVNTRLAEASLVGRFHDGTPLTLSDTPNGNSSNDFDYSEMIKTTDTKQLQNDSDASRCPFHAHARKSNPRTKDSKYKKILRRGVYYSESDEKQGLLFVSYQNSLEDQFEYIVKNRMMSPLIKTDQKYLISDFKNYDAPEAYDTKSEKEIYQNIYKRSGVDIFFAPKGTTYKVPKGWNSSDHTKESIEIERQLIDFEGGVYFFTPSISFLEKVKYFPIYDSNYKKVLPLKKVEINQKPFILPAGKASPKPDFLPGTIMHIGQEETIEKGKNNRQQPDIPYIMRDKQNFKYQLKTKPVPSERSKT